MNIEISIPKWLLTLINYIIFIAIVFLIGYGMYSYDLTDIGKSTIYKNLKFVSASIFSLLPLLVLIFIFIGLMFKKWTFKIEKLNYGGFNLIFDNPVRLYKRTICSFLDTKRTLFKIDFTRDNFDEAFNSFFQTYNFFREEMKILDNQRKEGRWNRTGEEREIYNITNDILQKLNEFLTTHQNNYRRWYKQVSDSNEIPDSNGDILNTHLLPINEIQMHYYRYDDLCNDFREINEYFMNVVKQEFGVNVEKWEWLDA